MKKTLKMNRWSMVDQSFLSLFITFTLIEFTNRGSGIIDGLFVSNYLDTDSIASVGIAKSIYSFIGIVSGLLAVGMQSRCTHELGKGEIKNFNRIFSAVFYVSIVVSLIFGIAVFFGAEPMAVLMGASGKGAALVKDAADYLRGIAIGIPSTIIAMMLSVACQLDSAKERVRKSPLIYFVGDVVLDYVAVKLHLGVLGIGIATSAAYYLQFVYLLFHFRNKNRMLLFTEFSINHKELLSVLSLGTEKALRSFSNFISPVIVNRIILLFGGTIAMSAFSIQKDLVNFTEIFASGLANATALQAGVYYGEMNSEAMLASDVLRILLLMLTVWLYYVVLTKKAFPSPNDYLALPDTFYFRPFDGISLDIRDTEDISLVSEQIQLFCRGHKIDRKTEMKAALCFEELAVNIIHFGFPERKRNPCIDFRLVISENELVMSLRDNCPMFDVERYIAHQIDVSRDDGDMHIGLKMIGSLTGNIRYVHSLENNNVILRLKR